MKPIKVTEEDVARFLSAKGRHEVYRGFTPLEIFRRELDLSRFWIYMYAGMAFILAIFLAGRHSSPEPFVFLPLPLILLINRQRHLEHLLIVHLGGKSVTIG